MAYRKRGIFRGNIASRDFSRRVLLLVDDGDFHHFATATLT